MANFQSPRKDTKSRNGDQSPDGSSSINSKKGRTKDSSTGIQKLVGALKIAQEKRSRDQEYPELGALPEMNLKAKAFRKRSQLKSKGTDEESKQFSILTDELKYKVPRNIATFGDNGALLTLYLLASEVGLECTDTGAEFSDPKQVTDKNTTDIFWSAFLEELTGSSEFHKPATAKRGGSATFQGQTYARLRITQYFCGIRQVPDEWWKHHYGKEYYAAEPTYAGVGRAKKVISRSLRVIDQMINASMMAEANQKLFRNQLEMLVRLYLQTNQERLWNRFKMENLKPDFNQFLNMNTPKKTSVKYSKQKVGKREFPVPIEKQIAKKGTAPWNLGGVRPCEVDVIKEITQSDWGTWDAIKAEYDSIDICADGLADRIKEIRAKIHRVHEHRRAIESAWRLRLNQRFREAKGSTLTEKLTSVKERMKNYQVENRAYDPSGAFDPFHWFPPEVILRHEGQDRVITMNEYLDNPDRIIGKYPRLATFIKDCQAQEARFRAEQAEKASSSK
jgi:hypothetical protein